MAVTYNIDDTYCPEGHVWTKVFNTMLYSDCYYCKGCDKIYRPTIEEVTREEFKEQFNSPRFDQIKQRALIVEANKKVTKEDLIKLGYLTS